MLPGNSRSGSGNAEPPYVRMMGRISDRRIGVIDRLRAEAIQLVSKKWLPNSSPIDTQPWQLLSKRLAQIRVEQRLGGLMYVVSGRK